ncbi:MAG: hypothetical protein HYZ00_06265 [Candidatus Hydrogenedentes bacterium]|nr:hypothetical protein [Candidatus Hydrogenedentota bacterium]
MKKYAIAAVVMMLGASLAFAASLNVPLFVDNAGIAEFVPNITGAGVTGVVTLKNNKSTDIECAIQYYNLAGDLLGPFGADSTFEIRANSSLAFRPVAEDPAKGITGPTGVVGQNGGQEGAQGVLVPDRPRSVDSTTPIPGAGVIDTAKNGSIVITWVGDDTDVQGTAGYFQTTHSRETAATSDTGADTTDQVVTFSYTHLLPPGVS